MQIVFSWHFNFRTHAESFSHVTLLHAHLVTRNGPKVLPEGPPGTHVVHGDRNFDCHDADFVLFGVTAEEIRWQSGVVEPHMTVRPLRRRRHLRQWARRERRSRTRHFGAPVLSSVRPSSCGPSRTSAASGLLPKKGRGCPSRFALPPVSPQDSSTWTRPPRRPYAPASTASFSSKIERRFMRRVAQRVRPRESGCPIHKKQLLSVLVVWAHPQKKRNQEQHALNGNTSPSADGSPPRSVRQRVDLANDDDLEATLVLPAAVPGAAADGPGRSHTDLEARMERLFTRDRELAGTLIRPEVDTLEMGIVAATEAHRRHILTMVPVGTTGPLSCSSHWARSPCTT